MLIKYVLGPFGYEGETGRISSSIALPRDVQTDLGNSVARSDLLSNFFVNSNISLPRLVFHIPKIGTLGLAL